MTFLDQKIFNFINYSFFGPNKIVTFWSKLFNFGQNE